ncbi:Alpha/Beta hydrolase protein [Mycena metata]|uniref:acylaminoacyl-peptidase n=1 Tax=Mycena metata TaxID=1033252 RepID=A0AAD7JGJ4_9AGAR|nr:Alpha/Beta hydrolase protein [Mycena metata]
MSTVYRRLSEIPVPTGAQFMNDVVQINSSIRDNGRDIKRSLTTSIFLGANSVSNTPTVVPGDVVASISAPAESVCFPRRAVLLETPEKERHLEIWVGNVLEASKEVTEAHGSFYSDEFFSAFSFSLSESAFMYVAEAEEPEHASEKFKFTPPLGEAFGGKKTPAIFIFRWETSVLSSQTSLARVSPILPRDHPILFGQPVFSCLDNDTIYATGYEYTRDGRLLGPKWCYNRPTGIWKIKLQSTLEQKDDTVPVKLTPGDLSCRSPRIYHEASGTAKLFWLSCASGGPHAGTFSLHSLDLGASEPASEALVDTVWEPRESDGFPGLYLDANLPTSPFLARPGKPFLIFSSNWGCRTTVVSVSTLDGTVKDLTPDSDGKLFSWTMLATDGVARFICSRSTPTIPPEIVLGQMDAAGEVSWRVIYTPYILPSLQTALSNLTYSVISIPGRGKTQTVVVRPSHPEDSAPPCLQFIHGGPHGAVTTAFAPSTASFALEGYTVSLPNYSGSIGFGEKSVRALLGNCGDLDVQDCIATVRHLVDLGIAVQGKGKQFVMGGSHGGFLAAHLISQFPEVFTAAFIRNPVIFTDAFSSDIPDWYFNEWNIEYPIYSSPQGFPSNTDNKRALPPRWTPAKSQETFASAPIAYVDSVTAHVLLHLGGSDLRVTPAQGVEYYHALKGNARNRRPEQEIEMYWFEKEGHSLDGVKANRIVWETSHDWLNKYCA